MTDGFDALLASGQQALRLGHYAQARESLESAYTLSETLDGNDLRRVTVQCLLAEAWFCQGDGAVPPAKLAHFGNAIGAIRNAVDRMPEPSEAAYHAAGLTYLRLADRRYWTDREFARQWYFYALEMLERAGSMGRLDLPQCLYRIASLRCDTTHRQFLERARDLLIEIATARQVLPAALPGAGAPSNPTFLPPLALWDDVVRLLYALGGEAHARDGVMRMCHHLMGYWK